jgi:multimeric flavodoxin WrbA
MRILGLGGSIRSVGTRSKSFIMDAVENSDGLDDFLKKAKASKLPLSNTEILSGAALTAAKNHGAEVDYFPLTRLFSRRSHKIYSFSPSKVGLNDEIVHWDTLDINPTVLSELTEAVTSADGILLSSPVYFGDRSSVLDKFFQIARRAKFLEGKRVAALSVGAKRNGGQETTNIYILSEASLLGALVVGNGPPNAQYGGTAVAGDRRTVLSDDWGLKSAYATGKRLSDSVNATRALKSSISEDIHIAIVVTMDTPHQRLYRKVSEISSEFQDSKTHFTILDLGEGNIERCLGCDICPIPELRQNASSYACIIQSKRDAMNTVRSQLIRSDAIVLAGLNPMNDENINDCYQAFTERTRFIRRNDFELTNIPLSSLTIADAGAQTNPFFSLKVMTSYIRHNAIICPPIHEIHFQGSTVTSANEGVAKFLSIARDVTSVRRNREKQRVSYKAEGYRDIRLDHTEALR